MRRAIPVLITLGVETMDLHRGIRFDPPRPGGCVIHFIRIGRDRTGLDSMLSITIAASVGTLVACIITCASAKVVGMAI